MRVDVKAFALTCALLWGFGLFVITWWIIAFEGSSHELTFLGRVYRGYRFTPAGSFIGLVWAFFDALIGGAIAAWLYNALASRGKAKTA